jgi:hypothetical protein
LSCLADVLDAAQAPGEALPLVEQAVELYEAKGDLVSAARYSSWAASRATRSSR